MLTKGHSSCLGPGVFDGPKVTEKLLMFETENLKDDSTDMEYFRHTGSMTGLVVQYTL